MIITGDIGGTKTNVALFETNGRELGETIAHKSFPSGSYPSLEAILEEFIAEHQPHLTHACFGVAGPVIEGHVETPNLAWDVNNSDLVKALKVKRASLINDLEAMAHGVVTLKSSQLHTLSEGDGTPRDGHRGLIAAGTGLGIAGIFWDGVRYRPIPSEGGHIDFAARTDIEAGLLQWLIEKVGGRVSYERVISGPGLFNVYSFLREQNPAAEPDWLAAEISGDNNPSAAISKAALENKSELAAKALDIFVSVYGAMAGNLALMLKATGGLYIGGGIAPKILEKIKDGTFIRAFTDKGRLSPLLESIPVHVILDDKTALYGAARCALDQDGAH